MNSPDEKLLYELSDLIVSAWNGSISEEQFLRLSEILRSNSQARDYYFELLTTFVGLTGEEGIVGLRDDNPETLLSEQSFDSSIWKALAETEKVAPSIQIDGIDKEDVSSQIMTSGKTNLAKSRREVSKLALYTAILSSAALFFILLFVTLSPPKPAIIGILSDSLDAVWEGTSSKIPVGSELRAGKMILQEGYAKIHMDSGAEMILQGYLDFELEGINQILLNRGKISCVVPSEAVGFVVRTPGATVVDYGTEFGILVDTDESAEVHVFKGEVELRAGNNPIKFDTASRVKTGMANRISFSTGNITSVSQRSNLFVRRIDSRTGFIWKGQDIDLADIIGGGNGFGTGKVDSGIDIITGRVISQDTENQRQALGTNRYMCVLQYPFIDGVFIPDGSDGNVQISSEGHFFSDFNDTTGLFFMPICNNSNAKMHLEGKYVSRTLSLSGTHNDSVICIHANAGITFDLDAIRKSIPHLKIDGFSAMCGISESAQGAAEGLSDSDFYVIVDGIQKAVHMNVLQKHDPVHIDISLTDNDRFLTLASTEGKQNFGDWGLFTRPVLKLELRSSQ